MDTQEIYNILTKLNFPYIVTSITQFCREEDGSPYDVWKIETDSVMAVLKKTSPEERTTLEAFFPHGYCGTPKIYGFAEYNGETYMLMEFFEGETMSHSTREKMILALDALVQMQEKFWGNTELADIGWTFEKRHTVRKKRLPYMEDLADAFSAYLEADRIVPRTLWFELAQTGESRNYFIMPNMLQFMGDVKDKKILDLGCGEGGYSRELTKRGAQLVSVDCSKKAIEYAVALANEQNLHIEHFVRNSNDLFDIESEQFDVVLCSMMLMDCADFEGTLREVVRVLKPNGRLFASVLHPCFDGNHESGIGRQGAGIDRQVVVMNYFEPKEWEAPLWKGTIPVIWRHRTLEDYVKTFLKAGLTIVDLNEPQATDEQAQISAAMAWLQKIPLYLYWELKK